MKSVRTSKPKNNNNNTTGAGLADAALTCGRALGDALQNSATAAYEALKNLEKARDGLDELFADSGRCGFDAEGTENYALTSLAIYRARQDLLAVLHQAESVGVKPEHTPLFDAIERLEAKAAAMGHHQIPPAKLALVAPPKREGA